VIDWERYQKESASANRTRFSCSNPRSYFADFQSHTPIAPLTRPSSPSKGSRVEVAGSCGAGSWPAACGAGADGAVAGGGGTVLPADCWACGGVAGWTCGACAWACGV